MPEKLKSLALVSSGVLALLLGIGLTAHAVIIRQWYGDAMYFGVILILLGPMVVGLWKFQRDIQKATRGRPKPFTPDQQEIRSLRGQLTKLGWDIEEEKRKSDSLLRLIEEQRLKIEDYERNFKAQTNENERLRKDIYDHHVASGVGTDALEERNARTIKELDQLRAQNTSLAKDIGRLRADNAAYAQENNKLKDANAAYEKEIASLKAGQTKAEQPRHGSDTSGTDKFTLAKRRFAKLYHPNSNRYDGIEKLVREALFKEFWSELETIERG